VADRHPDLVLVVDHLAKPPIRGDRWPAWRSELQAAAKRPNVVAKLSGLDTAAESGWTADELRPSVDVALEAFGPDRLMFGSDWPVCRLVSRYPEVMDATKRLISGLTTTEQDAIMGGTARRVYRVA
jgi:L-fuconolactonase